MRILITNHSFRFRAGTELFCRDIALALKRKGHHVVLYGEHLGQAAHDFQKEGLTLINDLDQLPFEPDLIHAQHHLVAMAALLRFPRVPAILVCHGAVPWLEAPVLFPSIRRFIAVDDPTRERLISSDVPPKQIRMLRTAVDLRRFSLRSTWAEKPQRILAFCSYLGYDENLNILREGCRQAGFQKLDTLGSGMGTDRKDPEVALARYDIVFAKGRSAHEAAATGAAVIVTDTKRIAGLLTTENYDDWRPLNFGFRTLQHPLSVDRVANALQSYRANDAREISLRIRLEANLDDAVQHLLEIYAETLGEEEALAQIPEEHFALAASHYQRSLSLHIQSHDLKRPAEQFLDRTWRRFQLWRKSP